jgi:hypothetical protein
MKWSSLRSPETGTGWKQREAAGGKALVLPADVANPDQVETAAQQVQAGPIDF